MTLAEAPADQSKGRVPLKLLVFAGIPPPVHGQAVMVAALLSALRADPAFSIIHIDPRLSQNSSEVGQWSTGKLFRLLTACSQAMGARLTGGSMAFYYVPAPGRRVPVFRDWIVLGCCRALFSATILHWHAVGLGAWTMQQANLVERWLTRGALRRAQLSIVLAPELAEDAAVFAPQRLIVVPNGIPDPLAEEPKKILEEPKTSLTEVLFLGLGSEAKGLFRALDGVILANARERGAFRLTFAGAFASTAEEKRFRQAEAASNGLIRHAGFAEGAKKSNLLRSANLLCFPSTYAHEGQPLVLLEALAHDLPIVTTRWRAIPGVLPASPHIHYVNPDRPEEITAALFQCRALGRPNGELRKHFLEHFTLDRHIAVLKEALLAGRAPN